MIGQYKIIGVCLSCIQQEDRLHCIEALNKHAVQNHCRLMIFNACSDMFQKNNINDQAECAVFRLINYDILDAMVLFPAGIYRDESVDEIITHCRKKSIPVFTVDKHIEGCINFNFDYANSFESLCRHVVEVHHCKNIFMIAGMRGNEFSESRIDVFRKVLKMHDLPICEEHIGYGDFWDGPTKECLKQWFEEQQLPFPDAIICANDTMAITVSKYLQDHGCRVPEDCIVTGFDGIMQINYHIPHMTTCTQDYNEMGRQMIETMELVWNHAPYTLDHIIPFHILYSESCGCVPTKVTNINDAVQQVYDRFLLAKERQHRMCRMQSAVSCMSSLSELPSILIEKFVFHTIVFAVNDDIFRAPNFGMNHKGKNAYNENVNVLYHRNFWTQLSPGVIKTTVLSPNIEEMLQREEPLIICTVHFMDMILGYCIFQSEIDYDEYEKINVFMNAIGSSLGIFHNQMHVKSINMQLKSANSELEKLYIHDHMTGLYNRRGFYRQINQQLEENKGKPLSVVIISADLDGLKFINDTYGHIEGDNAITTVGRALMTSALQDEICSRFGGDEFTVAGIIAETDGYFEDFQKRFRTYLENYNAASKKNYRVESSIGCCVMPLTDHLDLDQMCKIADNRMYEDKVARKKTRQH